LVQGLKEVESGDRRRDGGADPFDTPVLDRRIMGVEREIGQI
jgi:hypothetical protein